MPIAPILSATAHSKGFWAKASEPRPLARLACDVEWSGQATMPVRQAIDAA